MQNLSQMTRSEIESVLKKASKIHPLRVVNLEIYEDGNVVKKIDNIPYLHAAVSAYIVLISGPENNRSFGFMIYDVNTGAPIEGFKYGDDDLIIDNDNNVSYLELIVDFMSETDSVLEDLGLVE